MLFGGQFSVVPSLKPAPVSDPMKVLHEIVSRGGQFFRVQFYKRDGSGLRDMLCRRSVQRYVQGTAKHDRFVEDLANQCLTVWDVDVYRRLLREGKSEQDAGKGSYRRIPLDSVVAISGVPAEQLHA